MERIFELKPIKVSGKTCSAVAGMVVVAGNVYTVSSKSSSGGKKMPVVFYKNEKAIPVQTSGGSYSIAKHLNSITYYNHLFYIVTRNGQDENQIMAFRSNGIIEKKWKYPRSMIATINHFKGNNFLISVNGGKVVKYRMVQIGDEIKDVGLDFKIVADYSTGNDSFYDKKDKRLYVTKFKDKEHSAVFVYDLCHLSDGGRYYPEKVIERSGSEKFEIEGVGILNGLIGCVNQVKNGCQDDIIALI